MPDIIAVSRAGTRILVTRDARYVVVTRRGARGESWADIARRVGEVAGIVVPAGLTDIEVLALLTTALAEIVAAAGFHVIDSVRAATTANITLSGAQTIDGIAVVATNRVLVKDQTSASANGIYVAAAGAWSRATDFDQTAEVLEGSYVRVAEGDTASGAWVLVTPDPITVGTTAQTWRFFSLDAFARLYSTAPGKGASLVRFESGHTVQQLASAVAGQGSALIGYIGGEPGSETITQEDVNRRVVHVMDFVTDAHRASLYAGTPVDIAYAYNLATQAADAYSTALHKTIHAPELPHKILEPVFVRNGQTLIGGGYGALVDCIGNSGDVFTLGTRSNGTVDTPGPPTEISNFRTLGSGASGNPADPDCLVRVRSAGGRVHGMFISSADDHIVLEEASDVIISDIISDQGGRAFVAYGHTNLGTRNCTISNWIMFNMFQGAVFADNVFDLTFNNVLFNYPKIHGIYFEDGAENIRNIVFNGGSLLMNAHSGDHAGFEAAIRSRASNVQVTFAGMPFRKWMEYLILHDAGGGFELEMTGCVFDGDPTDEFNYSETNTTGKGYKNGSEDIVTFTGCVWRNIPGQVIELQGASAVQLQITGGSVRNCGGSSVILHGNTAAGTRLAINGLIGDDTQALMSAAGNGVSHLSNSARFTPTSHVIASAASLVVPLFFDFLYVTGTTAITSIAADSRNARRQVTFQLGGSQTWTNNGSTLKMAGGVNFAGTADDTITLGTADGTNWVEICRSVN